MNNKLWELQIKFKSPIFGDMIDFDIDDIREEIKNQPYEDKLAFLEDKESELDEILDAIV